MACALVRLRAFQQSGDRVITSHRRGAACRAMAWVRPFQQSGPWISTLVVWALLAAPVGAGHLVAGGARCNRFIVAHVTPWTPIPDRGVAIGWGRGDPSTGLTERQFDTAWHLGG